MTEQKKPEPAGPTAQNFLDALTPSDETKIDYIGEFSVPWPFIDEYGEEVLCNLNIPWVTIKEIMAAIRAHAEARSKC